MAVVASHRWYRFRHWLYDNPQRFEDQNILNVLNASILDHRYLVPWLVTFLKQTEQWYLGCPGFGCTSPARAISRSSRSKSGPVASGSVE